MSAAAKRSAPGTESSGAVREVWAQRWTSRDSWSGPEDEGASLHPSREHLDAFVRAQTRGRTGPAPEYYVCPEGQPRRVQVSATLFLEVQAAGEQGHRLSALDWRELELETELAEVRARKAKGGR